MIQIQTISGGVKFVFNDNRLYLQNGTIEYPLNALAMTIDDSNIVTFKLPNNDVALAVNLDEIGKTKAEMEQLYEDAFVGDTGGGGGEVTPEQVEEMIDEALTPIESAIDDIETALSGKASSSDVQSLSATTTAHTADTNVHVTASDKANWNGKADADDVEEQFEVAAIAMTELKEKVDEKANATNVYTKSEVNAVLATKATNADLLSLSATTTAHTSNSDIHVTLSDKTNWDAKANVSDVQAVSNGLTAHTSNSAIHVTASDKTNWDAKADASDVQAVSNGLTAHTADTTIHVTSQEKTAWDSKADGSRLGGLSFVKLTQAQYDALVTKDANTVYIISD